MKAMKMNEIELVQTIVFKDSEDKSTFDAKMYDALFNELAMHLSTYHNVTKENIIKWLEKHKSNISLEQSLKLMASSIILNLAEDKSQFDIDCRNYQTLPVNLDKVLAKTDETSIYFVLFFRSNALFYVRSIGDSLLVTPLSNVGDIYQVDMSLTNISVSKMSNLL